MVDNLQLIKNFIQETKDNGINKKTFLYSLQFLVSVVILWKYNLKFLNPAVNAISQMSRSFIVGGVQQNPAFYETSIMVPFILITTLLFYILAQNDFGNILGNPRDFGSYLTTILPLAVILISTVLSITLDYSPKIGLPFLLIGTTIYLSYLMNFENSTIFKIFKNPKENYIDGIKVFSPYLIFILISIFVSLFPIITENMVELFSLILITMSMLLGLHIFSESNNLVNHDKKNSALIFLIALPVILYSITRLLFLLHNPDIVTRERWDLSWSFMDDTNRFEINAWPIQPDFPEDIRWKFYVAAIINSIRITLVSIVLCTILGVIVGVTRLSSNKLASILATVYVEIFRNLPLAVLLFLVALQLGESLPLFTDEANISELMYFSNQGIYIPNPETNMLILSILLILGVWSWNKYKDYNAQKDPDYQYSDNPLLWPLVLILCIFLIFSNASHPDYVKDDPLNKIFLNIPGSWDIIEGSGFEITPEFLAMIIGLTLFTASVVAEIVRGSIQSLPRGQIEASISLGLSSYQRLRLVILPQALRSMIPLLNSQYMNVWKNSSLAIIVAYSDIFYVIFVMMNNLGKLIPLFLLLLVTYQAGSLLISGIMNYYNSRVTKVKI
jgi:general L-amino acid transport system permease protein